MFHIFRQRKTITMPVLLQKLNKGRPVVVMCVSDLNMKLAILKACVMFL